MIDIKPRQRLHLPDVCTAVHDLLSDAAPGFVWELAEQVTQAAGKHLGVRITVSACISLHHHALRIRVVEGRLSVAIVNRKRLGLQSCHGGVKVIITNRDLDQGVFSPLSSGSFEAGCGLVAR
jgi:hypothetical protein